MRKSIARFILLWTAGAAAGCAASAANPPRADGWIAYQGLLNSDYIVPRNGGFAHDVDDGAVPPFRVRVPPQHLSSSGSSRQASLTFVEMEGANFGSPGGAGLFLEFLRIELPAASRGSALDVYRLGDGPARRWGTERIRGARDLALEIDLRSDSASPAARLCRRLEVAVSAPRSGDRCRLDALLDAEDGWPIVARITRTVEGPNGLIAIENVTFERLSESQTSS